jgi:hypothetical protein
MPLAFKEIRFIASMFLAGMILLLESAPACAFRRTHLPSYLPRSSG